MKQLLGLIEVREGGTKSEVTRQCWDLQTVVHWHYDRIGIQTKQVNKRQQARLSSLS